MTILCSLCEKEDINKKINYGVSLENYNINIEPICSSCYIQYYLFLKNKNLICNEELIKSEDFNYFEKKNIPYFQNFKYKRLTIKAYHINKNFYYIYKRED